MHKFAGHGDRKLTPGVTADDRGPERVLDLRDPDGNGVELYRDRPRDEWPLDRDGNIAMVTERLDLDDLLRAAPPG